MKIRNTISNMKFWWVGKEENPAEKRERFVSSIITNRAFSKLTLQDKMLSLGKLITSFRSDNGYTPKSLERAIEILRLELNRQTIQTWNTIYSKHEIQNQ